MALYKLYYLLTYLHKHVDSVSPKPTRTLNFVRRNIYCCPPDVKTLAYTSLIRPHLEFASAAWDPYTARDITRTKYSIMLRILLKRLPQNDIHVWSYSCQRPRMAVPEKPQEECPLASFLQRSSWPFCHSMQLNSLRRPDRNS